MLDIERLRQVPLFAQLPDERLHWLLEQGQDVWLEPGQIHRAQGDPADHVFVLLEGEIRILKHERNQEVLVATYGENTLYGELPVLTGETHFWASGQATRRSHIFELNVASFWEMLSVCPCVTASILSTMAKRMQAVQTLSQHREKMVALGTLAAGLAHELNNPAAAAQRSTQRLREATQTVQTAALQFSHLTPDQQMHLASLRQVIMQRPTLQLAPLTQSDREDEVAIWLQAQGIPDCWRLASTLVTADLGIDWLEQVAKQFPGALFHPVLLWLEANLTGQGLLNELDHATERICELVKAIKDYSYMDQAPLQEVDIHEGIESTLMILGHKLKQGIRLVRDYDRQMPRITVYGSELNQVWTNLIDNAIDALNEPAKGEVNQHPTIYIHTRCEPESVLIEICDNGPGIPDPIRSQIFEPFFTTKGVGQGTGLGLHIAYRVVVEQHQGDLRVFSEPGQTRFQIRLPLRFA